MYYVHERAYLGILLSRIPIFVKRLQTGRIRNVRYRFLGAYDFCLRSEWAGHDTKVILQWNLYTFCADISSNFF